MFYFDAYIFFFFLTLFSSSLCNVEQAQTIQLISMLIHSEIHSSHCNPNLDCKQIWTTIWYTCPHNSFLPEINHFTIQLTEQKANFSVWCSGSCGCIIGVAICIHEPDQILPFEALNAFMCTLVNRGILTCKHVLSTLEVILCWLSLCSVIIMSGLIIVL